MQHLKDPYYVKSKTPCWTIGKISYAKIPYYSKEGKVYSFDSCYADLIKQYEWTSGESYAYHFFGVKLVGLHQLIVALVRAGLTAEDINRVPRRERVNFICELVDDLTNTGLFVDHISGDITDTTSDNLRLVNYNQSAQNRRRSEEASSPYKGDITHSDGTHSAQITADLDHYVLGKFHTGIEAGLAYDISAIQLHGEHGCINFPPWIYSDIIFANQNMVGLDKEIVIKQAKELYKNLPPGFDYSRCGNYRLGVCLRRRRRGKK